jgi:diguanylate cyclase (GGDEF)-like protein/PAS domain S-box-containing protein
LETSFYKNLIYNLSDSVYFVDQERVITYWNKSVEALTGFTCAEVLGRRCSDNILVHTDENGTQLCQNGCPLAATIRDSQTRRVRVYCRHKAGHRVPVTVQAGPIFDDQGQILGAVESFHNETDTVSLEHQLAQLKQLALVDQLTQAGNRRYAEITLRMRLEELSRYGWPCGVIMADIDHFKLVNDTHGHLTGDRVLEMAAATIMGTTRAARASFFRWGGEEFLTIMANADESNLVSTAERQRRLVEASSLPIGSARIQITVSAGMALARAGEGAEELMKRADKALYESKQTGRNRCTLTRL